MRILLFSFLLVPFFAWSDIAVDTRPRVPKEIDFAGMRLKLTDAARRDIQKDVDALTQSQKYMEIKADRARLYFPIIEKILVDEGVPADFKYLALQESALISDAVSSANAVGFWQFKDFTGREVGLRIDKSIDERLNIVASTHGAAKYFKRHNFYFDNWVYTILAHMTGRSGAGKYVDHSNFGKKKMTLDGKTHWYIKRFLAHKIAYENMVNGKHSQGLKLTLYTKGKGKSLSTIAKSAKVDEGELKKYNKWLKKGKVPEEKVYTVIIPSKGKSPKIKESKEEKSATKKIAVEKSAVKKAIVKKEAVIVVEKQYPSLGEGLNANATIFIKINGLPCILAKNKDDLNALAKQGGLSPERFAMYNDLQVMDDVVEGDIYYLKSKRSKARIYFYTVQRNESLWDVSQKFGIKLLKLAKLNRMSLDDDLKEGRVMWLHKRRPDHMPIEYRLYEVENVKIVVPVVPVVSEASKKTKKTKKVKADIPIRRKKTPVDPAEVDEEIAVIEEPVLVKVKSKKVKGLVPHTVKEGETLYGISKMYGVAVSDILEWNEMANAGINKGQVLLMKGKDLKAKNEVTPKKTKVTFHEVVVGDTMYSVSRKYDIPVDKLMEMNQKDNFNLSLGEKLKVNTKN